MKKLILSALSMGMCLTANAYAAPMTLGGVDFDSDNAASTVLWAQGGVFTGLDGNRREACVDYTDVTSTVGATGVECRAAEAAGFDLESNIELDKNNANLYDPDVVAAFFDQPLANGAGNDLVLFETLDQDDSPTVTLILNGAQLNGTKLAAIEVDGKKYTMWGFDFSDLPLGMALNDIIDAPLYIQTFRDDENTPVGSADIAAIVGLNFADTPEVPLPAAAWLFIAGISGLGFAGRKKKSAA